VAITEELWAIVEPAFGGEVARVNRHKLAEVDILPRQRAVCRDAGAYPDTGLGHRHEPPRGCGLAWHKTQSAVESQSEDVRDVHCFR